MSVPKKLAIMVLLAISTQGCKKSSITEKQFNYSIIFSDATEYFFEIQKTPFIKNEILFINDKNLEIAKDKLKTTKKILLTHKSNNEILNNEILKEKIFYLSKIKFSLKKSIDFLLNEKSINLQKTLIFRDKSLNSEDLEYLEKKGKEKNANITLINEKNISYMQTFITPQINTIILFSLRDNNIILKKISNSPFFKNIKFVLIGNTRKDLKIIKLRYIITLKEPDLIKIVKDIENNFQYEFSIYKQ
ncbi:hypothetical protein [Borreliella bissettiae]|uniref:Lipoprotein n=1 Tax=Borrelia bissettiae (strain DSM 17990 / CIP 109136 / DN127) TaxID=521010 RepID=G0AL02_BORBD|nr:hypothetical protein [Borreliella bissettiae]AEL18378.1 putative lipoprotein [Borreliella bissettiae DN127]WKC99632.1 hypothetical protein QIA02_00935 [Borreliella bissettiae]